MPSERYNRSASLLGLVGQLAGGKDTIADYLEEKYGFTHISTGDLLREILTQQLGREPDRDDLRTGAKKLRTDQGGDVLVRRALIDPPPRLVLSGIRAINEARRVKEVGGVLIACTAPIEIRYRRAQQRNRLGDQVTLEQFQEQERKESEDTDPNAQNLPAVTKMADYRLDNSGSINDLYRSVDDLMRDQLGISA